MKKNERIAALEQRVAQLEAELHRLRCMGPIYVPFSTPPTWPKWYDFPTTTVSDGTTSTDLSEMGEFSSVQGSIN